MNLGAIIKDAITYPTSHIKALLIYLILAFLIGLVMVFTGIGGFVKGSFNFESSLGAGLFGIIVSVFLFLLMEGFSLDIVKFGIDRSSDAPEVNFARQISNGIKYFIVSIVYLIIPVILFIILGMLLGKIGLLIGYIILLIFAFVLLIAVCRLADTDELSYALDFRGAIGDLRQIGVAKVIVTIVVSVIVGLIIVFAITFLFACILGIINSQSLISVVVPIFSMIVDAWLLFYTNRVMGLLYSNK